MAIIHHVDLDPAQEPTVRPGHGGLVAVFVGDHVPVTAVRAALAELSTGETVGLLAGKSRRGERMAEHVAIAAAKAVERVPPARKARHPADDLIRRATRVLIVADEASDMPIGRLLQLTDRYAKPVRVIRVAREPAPTADAPRP